MGRGDDWRNVRMIMIKSANTERIMMSLCLSKKDINMGAFYSWVIGFNFGLAKQSAFSFVISSSQMILSRFGCRLQIIYSID